MNNNKKLHRLYVCMGEINKEMRKIILVLIQTKFLAISFCHAQSFLWSVNYEDSLPSCATQIVSDASGNVYIIGTVLYSPDRAPSMEKSLLRKYSPNGDLIWSKNLPQAKLKIAIDRRAILLIIGRDSSGYFITKYDTSGTLLSKIDLFNASDGIYKRKILSITTDSQNSYYICGYFGTTSVLGQTEYGCPNQKARFYIAKFDSSDSFIWARVADTLGIVTENVFMTCDRSDNCIIGGQYSGTLSISSVTITATNTFKGFLMRVSQAGTIKWMESFGTSEKGESFVTSLKADTFNYIYAVGYYYRPLTIGNTVLTTHGDYVNDDIYIVKVDSSGGLIWVKEISGPNIEFAPSICDKSDGSAIYLAGYYKSRTIIGGDTLSTVGGGRYRTFGSETFLTKFSNDGNPIWAKDFNTLENSSSMGIGVTFSNGYLYVIGTSAGTVDCDSHELTSETEAMYLLKLSDE
jgi:hypothetical protein